MHRASILFTSVLLLAGLAVAQDSPAPEGRRSLFINQTEPLHVIGPDAGVNFMFQQRELGGEIAFVSAEMAGMGEVVTAAPYTATAVTETTQVLADGNRIVNKKSAFVARDSQGRTRREETLARIGPLSVDSPKLIFISDPVAHTVVTLEPGRQAAMLLKTQSLGSGSNPGSLPIVTTRRLEGPGKIVISESIHSGSSNEKNQKSAKLEDLGTQTIEGILADGKRETVTIPAGQIGNDRPIDIVSESWYSAELHTVVLRKHSDPRSGESVYRLTDIKRGEPDASLFQVPSGYKTSTEPIMEFKREFVHPKE